MNRPSHPTPPFEVASPPYDLDTYGWALAQARLIRERRLAEVDWDNVAEEIESLGRSEKRSAESALKIVLLHQLKWQHQPLFRSKSWRNSIAEHLRRFDDEMSDNPSLKPKLDEILRQAYRRARFEAAQETGLDPSLFPELPPSWDSIRGDLPDQ
jgi:hypothetical protein